MEMNLEKMVTQKPTQNPDKYAQYKKIVATLVYVQSEDLSQTLMLLRNKKENDEHQGKYNGLGGKSEIGEDPHTCAIREIQEEAGITIKPIYVANLTFKDFTPSGDWEVHVFRAKGYEGKLKNLNNCKEGDLMWVPTKDLLKLNLWDGDKIFLKYLNSDKFFFGNFTYDSGKLVNHQIHFM